MRGPGAQHGHALTWTKQTASDGPRVTSEELSEPSTDPFVVPYIQHLASDRPGIVLLTSPWRSAFAGPDLADYRGYQAHPRSPGGDDSHAP
jgi:hypothetical protein